MADTIEDFVSTLQQPENVRQNRRDPRNHWLHDPSTLISRSNIHSFTTGTGHAIFTSKILPAIARAEFEVILVTCFWARSATLDDLSDALKQLSRRAQASGRKVRVRIGFSSSSLSQKLFHPRSLDGRRYPSQSWQKKLHLPAPEDLAGLDLVIKSVFVLPFSVMHPKFVIVDRQVVLLPSCNVSWEDWFEGCIELRGPILGQFWQFYEEFWSMDVSISTEAFTLGQVEGKQHATDADTIAGLITQRELELCDVPTILLPSSHHANPRFRLPWQSHRAPPPTPLNIYLLALFANAKNIIDIQTPNLTSAPALDALVSALSRGVDVKIITCERLMIMEQLVTALTTTHRCIKQLVHEHKRLVQAKKQVSCNDPEAGLISRRILGRLTISYLSPLKPSNTAIVEPNQSHLKLTMVDEHTVILGSGNMDRASWYTSQELGVAMISSPLAMQIKHDRDAAMAARTRVIYEG